LSTARHVFLAPRKLVLYYAYADQAVHATTMKYLKERKSPSALAKGK